MQKVETNWRSTLRSLEQFYRDVDRLANQLRAVRSIDFHCGQGCHTCCQDRITVFDVEAENIQCYHADLIARGIPHPEGACAFLDEMGSCRIYSHRPYVCRTQGLPLRWIEEHPGRSPVEKRDICPLNQAGPPLEQLPAASCWSIGPFEGRLARLQADVSGGALHRVPLRELFHQDVHQSLARIHSDEREKGNKENTSRPSPK